jgi:hypothetical protein
VHCPEGEQPSPLEPHETHRPPPAPQAVAEGATHALLEQHPVGHAAMLHVQRPLTHARPAPQAEPPPQEQVPAAEQPSALRPHAMHEPPFAPHAPAPGAVQVGPEQQPFVHVTLHPAQAPALHTSVDGQLLHAFPPAPHAPC